MGRGRRWEGRRRCESGSYALEAERIVIATGTTPSPLGVPGEAEFFGQGLGSSAISYSHLLRDRTAVVIGDSDRAIEAAIECAEQCEEVSLILEPHATYSHRHLELPVPAKISRSITATGRYALKAIHLPAA